MADNSKTPPAGQRFTLVYGERGKPMADSPRMRRRLSSLIEGIEASSRENLAERAEKELGIPSPWSQHGSWWSFLGKWDLKDVLDLVTIAYRFIVERERHNQYGMNNKTVEFLREVQRIFQEENVHYAVDARGGVHFQFDAQFANDRAATIASLHGNRYENARHAFDGAMNAFSQVPPDGKNAIRGVFAAAENVFKLITSKDRLGAKEADDLGPIIEKRYATDGNARNCAKKMLASLKDWVDAAHFYRHEAGTPELTQPPLPLAVYLVSTGAAHLRWLAEIASFSATSA